MPSEPLHKHTLASPVDMAGGTIAFDQIKSNYFRVIYTTGVIGSITPDGKLTASFYNERVAIPQRIVNRVNPDGTLGDEILESRQSRQSVVREIETELIMDIATAVKLQQWLTGHIFGAAAAIEASGQGEAAEQLRASVRRMPGEGSHNGERPQS